MQNIELLGLGIRLVGIYAAFQGLQFIGIAYSSISQMSNFSSEPQTTSIIVLYACLVVLYFIMVFFLIKKPIYVAKLLLPKSDVKEPIVETTAPNLEVAAFTILGVYITAAALPDLLYDASRLWHAIHTPQFFSGTPVSLYTTNLCISVSQLCIGLYLCLQASGLRKLIYKIREFGYK